MTTKNKKGRCVCAREKSSRFFFVRGGQTGSAKSREKREQLESKKKAKNKKQKEEKKEKKRHTLFFLPRDTNSSFFALFSQKKFIVEKEEYERKEETRRL